MSELVGVGFKMPKKDVERFKEVLEQVGLNQTKFFRACVDRFTGENREEFLKILGFEKRFYWSKGP